MYKLYNINIAATFRTDYLGKEEIILPYSEELDCAILLINKLCSEEVQRMKKHHINQLIMDIRSSKSGDESRDYVNNFLKQWGK